jgi:hypothetical protein
MDGTVRHGRYRTSRKESFSILKIVVDELKMANIYHRRFKCKNREG